MDITLIIQIIIGIVVIALTRYAIPALKAWTKKKDYDELDYWLKKAVLAMEEQYKLQKDAGNIKFGDVRMFLESKGYTFDEKTIEILIDGMVKETVNAMEK